MNLRSQTVLIVSLVSLVLLGGNADRAAAQPAVQSTGAPPVRIVDGSSWDARLTNVTADWQLTLAAEPPRTLPISQLVTYGRYRDSDRGPVILLADGGRLRADVLEISPQAVKIESRLWLEAELRIGALRAIVLAPPTDPQARDALERRIRDFSAGQDLLLLASGDQIGGQLAPGPTGHLWTLDSGESLRIRTEGRDLEVPLERILAVVFNPSLVERSRAAGLRAWVGFDDGTLLHVQKLTAGAGVGRIQTVAGLQLAWEAAGGGGADDVWRSISMIQPLGTELVYLSDTKPVSYRHIPFLTRQWPYRDNASVTGGQLRVGGHVFPKGIGMHSTSRLAYAAAGYARFEADVALDDTANEYGSVVFRVFINDVDGQWQAAYESPVVRVGDAPLPISVETDGARALALIVDYADHGDVGDHANWLNARLIRK